MGLNPSNGNMYNWGNVATWNPLGGECLHGCSYCYVKKGRLKTIKKYQGKIKLAEKELKTNLYKCRKLNPPFTIFVCSCNDLFAEKVPLDYIQKIINICWKYQNNTYLFQSKNPGRFSDFYLNFPPKTILGTTIESNRNYNNTKAPSPAERAKKLSLFGEFKTMISIEPIMDFDLEEFISLIKKASPDFVSIGADSKKNILTEPNSEKIKQLIQEIKAFSKVKKKKNLNRLIVK